MSGPAPRDAVATPDAVTGSLAPRRRDDVTCIELDGETVVYADGRIHRLDAIATIVWNCFDGTLTVAEIVDDLVDVFDGADTDRVAADVLACVRELGRGGLLDNVVEAGEPRADE